MKKENCQETPQEIWIDLFFNFHCSPKLISRHKSYLSLTHPNAIRNHNLYFSDQWKQVSSDYCNASFNGSLFESFVEITTMEASDPTGHMVKA